LQTSLLIHRTTDLNFIDDLLKRLQLVNDQPDSAIIPVHCFEGPPHGIGQCAW
jgi:hypothetical protein